MSRTDGIKGLHDLVQEANKVVPNSTAMKTLALHTYFHGIGSGTVDVSALTGSGITIDEFINGIPDLKKIHEAIADYSAEPDQHQKDLAYSHVYEALFKGMIKVR